jgi:hypothetical protein
MRLGIAPQDNSVCAMYFATFAKRIKAFDRQFQASNGCVGNSGLEKNV